MITHTVHSAPNAEIIQLKNQLECIIRQHQDLCNTNKTISSDLRTTSSRQRAAERRAAASDMSVFGPLRTKATKELHELEDMRNELQAMSNGATIPSTLEASIQRAMTAQSNVETVARL